jgi:DNA-binding YbaB/EbfC family protein
MKGFGGGGNSLQKIMQQANQMQIKMKKAQDELASKEFEGASGGEAVKVKVNGASRLVAVTIKPDVMSAGDVDMLQDLIVTAANDALKNARETIDKEMAKITGGAGIPGMF